MTGTWRRVSKARRCPICEKADYCTLSVDGKAAHCMRVESATPDKKREGWIHRIDGDPLPPEGATKKVADVPGLARKMFTDKLAGQKREKLAKSLGVSVESLVALRVGIGWDHDGREFASFPSRDAQCRVIGITRRYGDGAKKTLAGTRNGVFVPADWFKLPGTVCVVEGASDVAALLTHGFPALGRPSNVGGADVIGAYLFRRAKGRPAIVIGENDRKPERVGTQSCPKDCSGCAWCWPGRYGAVKVAGDLGVAWKMTPVAYKDIREWSMVSDFRAVFAEWVIKENGAKK